MLKRFPGAKLSRSGQHKDFEDTRKSSDAANYIKLTRWFESYSPFLLTNVVISIVSGLVGPLTIETLLHAKKTCKNVFKICIESIVKIIGLLF